jgi:hypothetical protein
MSATQKNQNHHGAKSQMLSSKTKNSIFEQKRVLFNSNSAIFQLYHDENKLIFFKNFMEFGQ